MEDNRESLLTNELYEIIIEKLVKDMVELKQDKDSTLSRISIEKEVLKELKEQLKLIKKNIKNSKRNLRIEKNKLININDKLNEKNHTITDLNYKYISEFDYCVDTSEYIEPEPKKR